MPRFNAVHTVLRGPKDTTLQYPAFDLDPFAADGDSLLPPPVMPITWDDDFYRRPVTPRPDDNGWVPAPAPPLRKTHGPAPRLVALADAQRRADIVYRSVAVAEWGCQAKLLPLAVAAARPDIKRRGEGFELREAQRYLALVSAAGL
ncbi:hypothetical protein PsYK624_141570 [Phanerochaete sordida]|uniref:Uncharacterized protein n=1 Tax=Phanerochaete sordida TaxID=48140 RepID=A0A9P3GR15_9APHY|nr:hypothetical protein PsYK624_141570 [Phanerochaete sordida]